MAPIRRSRARPVLGDGISHCTTQFIDHFAKKAAQKPRRAPFTAQQHDAFRRQVGSVRFLMPAWADNTKLNIAGILRKWKAYVNGKPPPVRSHVQISLTNTLHRYCKHMKQGEWRSVLEAANKAVAMDFLLHLCETCRITSWGTNWQYFRQYKQRKLTITPKHELKLSFAVYASTVGQYMNLNASKEVYKV